MYTAFIINTLNKRFKKIDKHYQGLLKDFKLEEVHDFRVQMKKLRAFIRLFNAALPTGKQIKITAGIKSFYDIAGKIRNIQLHKQRVTSLCEEVFLNKPSLYLQDIEKEENRQRKKADKAAKKNSFKRLQKTLERQVNENFKAEPAKDFTLQKESRLYELLSLPVYSDETLHEIRKLLKDLLYNHIFIRPYLETFYFENFAAIGPLADKLGEFQDWFISVELMNEIDFNSKEQKEEKNRLLFIKEEFQKRKGDTKQRIIQLFQNLSTMVNPFQPGLCRDPN